MNILIIGGGGREHAIALALSRSPRVRKMWCAPGNGGIASLCECVPIAATDLEGVLAFCRKNRPDLVVVTPDDPLALGMVDLLEQNGFPAFGPRKDAALIESSKSFAKDLMARHHIPTAACRVFDELSPALDYVASCPVPVVVKADGLALGKGVFICQTRDDAAAAVRSIMEEKLFGQAGARVVIEEFLTGPEVSVLCFADGETLVPMPAAQDHKRALAGDRGPNTGGMGAFSPVSCYTPELARQCMDEIFLPTVRAMKAEGREFRGVLYFSLMLTPDGPRVIEYNCRFGDPETQAVLPLLRSDLLDIFLAVRGGRLREVPVEFDEKASCCVVMASGGYPGAYEKGLPIFGLGAAEKQGCTVFHAGTAQKDGLLVTSGGRVLGVSATADTLKDAVSKAYAGVSRIAFYGASFRRDIAQKDEAMRFRPDGAPAAAGAPTLKKAPAIDWS